MANRVPLPPPPSPSEAAANIAGLPGKKARFLRQLAVDHVQQPQMPAQQPPHETNQNPAAQQPEHRHYATGVGEIPFAMPRAAAGQPEQRTAPLSVVMQSAAAGQPGQMAASFPMSGAPSSLSMGGGPQGGYQNSAAWAWHAALQTAIGNAAAAATNAAGLPFSPHGPVSQAQHPGASRPSAFQPSFQPPASSSAAASYTSRPMAAPTPSLHRFSEGAPPFMGQPVPQLVRSSTAAFAPTGAANMARSVAAHPAALSSGQPAQFQQATPEAILAGHLAAQSAVATLPGGYPFWLLQRQMSANMGPFGATGSTTFASAFAPAQTAGPAFATANAAGNAAVGNVVGNAAVGNAAGGNAVGNAVGNAADNGVDHGAGNAAVGNAVGNAAGGSAATNIFVGNAAAGDAAANAAAAKAAAANAAGGDAAAANAAAGPSATPHEHARAHETRQQAHGSRSSPQQRGGQTTEQ